MRRYLVVSNQTLLTEQLQQELLLRAEAQDSVFYFIVPDTAKSDYSPEWDQKSRRDSSGARQRMRQTISALRAAGASATGSLEAADPLEAIRLRVEREGYDEILVSTLPKRLSRWLKLDLPSRIGRAVDLPVTTIIAKDV